MSTTPKFRIAICGGGVGGLTLAVALSRYPDIVVDVYEAAQSFYEVGAGFGIWPRAFKVLRNFGPDFERQLLQRCGSEYTEKYVPAIKFRKSDQPVGIDLFYLMTKGNQLRIHRADFHGILLSHLPPSCTTHNAKRLKSYTQPFNGRSRNSPITLTFGDGSTATCDVLIGADGIRSAVRSCMMRELAEGMHPNEKQSVLSCINPVWSGATAYRTLISAEKLRTRCPNHSVFRGGITQYMGKDAVRLSLNHDIHCAEADALQFFLVYTISRGKYINFAGFTLQPDLVDTAYEADARIPRRSFQGKANHEWVGELTAEQFVEPFKDFEEDAKVLLECVDRGTLWAVHTVKTLPSTNFGRVALLGDAAHGMLPFQGAGAGLSIEDAYLLATVLGHKSTTLAMVPRALAIYDKLRRPFSSDVAMRSRLCGQLYTFQKAVPLHEFGNTITKNSEWAWLTELDDALEEAIKLVEDSSINIR
ncbi:FAD/NAD(P)-binding domain-containing protein [Suillus clintonianus]|uniref:FAD/NAD(P)-binding domain-containing protein n=1 Tax=Suillus clintonianus TaxID=1904413 RepID=UPI001B866BA1|nr:FAD/NAD(P)-binding domain-containing protein [Suillus clintonianus]KAG2128278.1 FAD/NAD(P)-binding domain-containing protein [Suillus clintonianus]